MSRWSGRGIPPTRRKLHRWRAAQLRERQADAKEQRSMESRFDFSWNKKAGKVIINPERFVLMWTDDPENREEDFARRVFA